LIPEKNEKVRKISMQQGCQASVMARLSQDVRKANLNFMPFPI